METEIREAFFKTHLLADYIDILSKLIKAKEVFNLTVKVLNSEIAEELINPTKRMRTNAIYAIIIFNKHLTVCKKIAEENGVELP